MYGLQGIVTPRPLLFIGNKRSGSSHLTRLLNLHPDIFVTHESDVMWILYQWSSRLRFMCYPWDGPLGMTETLMTCGQFLVRDQPADGLFQIIQEHLMARGSTFQAAEPNKRPLWLGDKKPVQHADPRLQRFIGSHFDDAKYIHLIRSPRAVVASTLAAAETWAPVPYWRYGTAKTLLDRWVIHEQWVLQMKAQQSIAIVTVRFEDLCKNAANELDRICDLLGLEMTPQMASSATAMTRSTANKAATVNELGMPDHARALLERYGYE